MLAYVKNNVIEKYPVSFVVLKNKFPSTSFPNSIEDFDLSFYGTVKVEDTEIPSINNETQKVSEGTPELVNGIWKQTWVVENLTETEKQQLTEEKKYTVRLQRNRLLTETDWTQSRDVTLDNDADWKTYRQELRDITTQDAFPYNVIWPTKPE
jgi:hypothetical protein